MSYFSHYPPELIAHANMLLDENKSDVVLLKKYPHPHSIRTNRALYDFVIEIKKEYMRQSEAIKKIVYDERISALKNSLGEHKFISRVQGKKLKASNEIRIASVFKTAPLQFLRFVCVHELAHLREKEHNKSFYRLCKHMEPDYHQLEFEMRLFLAHIEKRGALYT